MERPQVPQPQYEHDYHEHWNAQLFSCMNNPGQCCTTCWCPCITFGKNKGAYNHQENSSESCLVYLALLIVFTIAIPFYQASLRGDIRNRYSIPGSFYGDFCISCCCGCCALVQEHKELKFRGKK